MSVMYSNRILNRDSSMEALRIIAMSMILLYHFAVHASPKSIGVEWWDVMRHFVIAGVDIFIMISGYFGIKLRWRGVLSIIFTIAFFVAINYALCVIAEIPTKSQIALKDIFIFPMSRSGYWFIECYWLLMLTAPVLNAGLKAMNSAQLRTSVAVLTFVTIYGCNIGRNSAEICGYGFFNFVYLYVLGYWLSKETFICRYPQWWYLAGFFLTSLLTSMGFYITKSHDMVQNEWFDGYNFVFTIMAAACLVVYFSRFSFKSRMINFVAASALGCYMLQDGLVGFALIYDMQKTFVTAHSIWLSIAMFAGCFIGFWVLSMMLTYFLNMWLPWLINMIVAVIPAKLKREIW